jgi:hypothetical protein
MNHETAVANVSDIVRLISDRAGANIQAAIIAGTPLPVTLLSKKLGEELDVGEVLCYHVITKYMQARGDLKIKMGPRGGIVPK